MGRYSLKLTIYFLGDFRLIYIVVAVNESLNVFYWHATFNIKVNTRKNVNLKSSDLFQTGLRFFSGHIKAINFKSSNL